MAKSTNISFSKEHKSKANPYEHVDVYRKNSDSNKSEKIKHCSTESKKVPINKK